MRDLRPVDFTPFGCFGYPIRYSHHQPTDWHASARGLERVGHQVGEVAL